MSDTPDLFLAATSRIRVSGAPLAERMRPLTLLEFVGQQEILGEGKILKQLIERELSSKNKKENAAKSSGFQDSPRSLPSILFWGPPGTGKTTLAKLIANAADAYFAELSAVTSGVKDVREVIQAATERLSFEQRRTVLFLDEIHRFNKSQQDALLPSIENGTISLLGATTENPSFEINKALLSRCRVFTLKPLSTRAIEALLDRALKDEQRGLGQFRVHFDLQAKEILCQFAGGDARSALNALELAVMVAPEDAGGERTITEELAREALQRNNVQYDKSGEEHYNLASAFQKSIRHSDPDAALYYLARMIEGGEDPMFIARRLVRTASEDIGLAEPQAVLQALAAKQTVEFIGFPECDSALAQATIYLACAPKSNAVYKAMNEAKEEVGRSGALPVPLHYRNAPTGLMKELGYHEGYQYDHDWPEKISPQEAFPEKLRGTKFYEPGDYGFEKEVKRRIAFFKRVRKKLREGKLHADEDR